MASNTWTKKDLEDLIKEVMGIQTITPMIKKQINRFIIEEDMSFKEMARCIVYWTEVEGKEFNPAYGIAILPNLREHAAAYFNKLALEQKKQSEEAQKIVEYQDNNIIFNIKSLRHKKRQPKQFNIADIDIEGDEE